MDHKLEEFALELSRINAIKFGNFQTKVGLMTPLYCDLRVIVSYPKLMDTLASLIIERTKDFNDFDVICGVPYTALPIATTVSVKTNVPMVMRRKEPKHYGTKKLIEGHFKKGDNCLIIEDVVTSGSSILETVRDLRNSDLIVKDVVVLLNREQGGERILKENGINMHALLNITQLLQLLKEERCIELDVYNNVRAYLRETQVPLTRNNIINRLKLSYSDRIKHAKNPVAAKLLKVMSDKQTNLCIAADLTDATDILNLAEDIGPHICILKTHVDIITNFNEDFVHHLKEISLRHNFILLEDRKFADIGKTVEYQYSNGIYKISSWANAVTAHSLIGRSVLEAIKKSEGLPDRGVFLLAQTSAADNLITDSYTNSTVKLAGEYEDMVTGIVCQAPLFLEKAGFLQLTPGVQLNESGDNLGQQYNTPESVIIKRGADIAVVGRGITKSSNRVETAEKYKEILWNSYLKRIA